MCIGVPMQVVSKQQGYAVCEGMGETRLVDTLLVGEQRIGSWLLVFLDSAREVLSEESAREIAQALQALNLTLRGEHDIDHLFSDLVNREPQLPEHLRSAK
ncbi:MAG: HypC/HybG/HupF family hydrogenase formation chaperone [Candidatus Thiodiazotropha sp.]